MVGDKLLVFMGASYVPQDSTIVCYGCAFYNRNVCTQPDFIDAEEDAGMECYRDMSIYVEVSD